MISRRHLERHSAGGIRLRLSGRERELLAWLASDLGARLADVAEMGDEDGPDEIRPLLTSEESRDEGGPDEIRPLQPDDDLVRLFPPAYAEDPEGEREYRELMQDELLDGKRDALRVFSATLERDELTEEELEVWLRVLNDLRLVLGTRLEVTEETYARRLDPRDSDAHELAVYGYLSWLQEQAVEAAAEGLPGR